MTDQKIRDLAFANGFMAKWTRPGFGPDIHDYVFEFARAVRDAALDEAVDLVRFLDFPDTEATARAIVGMKRNTVPGEPK